MSLAMRNVLTARPVAAPKRATRGAARGVAAHAAADMPEPTPTPPPKAEDFGSVMGFSGWAPEVINGRLAMVGFLAGLGAEFGTGDSFPTQFAEHPIALGFTIGIFTLASFMPLFQGAEGYNAKPKSVDGRTGPFTADAEMMNGRGAMIGLAAMLLIEGAMGGPLVGADEELDYTPTIAPPAPVVAAAPAAVEAPVLAAVAAPEVAAEPAAEWVKAEYNEALDAEPMRADAPNDDLDAEAAAVMEAVAAEPVAVAAE